jgi:hypothetical protein
VARPAFCLMEGPSRAAKCLPLPVLAPTPNTPPPASQALELLSTEAAPPPRGAPGPQPQAGMQRGGEGGRGRRALGPALQAVVQYIVGGRGGGRGRGERGGFLPGVLEGQGQGWQLLV